jgi:hypothetical protein
MWENCEDSQVKTGRGMPELHNGHYQKNQMIESSMRQEMKWQKNPTHIEPAQTSRQ